MKRKAQFLPYTGWPIDVYVNVNISVNISVNINVDISVNTNATPKSPR